MPRKVQTYKFDFTLQKTVEGKIGDFIQYGADFEEFGSGPGNYTVAIVEMPDGSVKSLPVDKIKFIIEE